MSLSTAIRAACAARPRPAAVLRLAAACAAAALVLTGRAWTTESLPRRLVIGLDGVGFADMAAAQQAGAFRAFHPVSRLVSTFPSISDIAWSEIFQVAPPPGYQRVYFRLDAHRTIGGGLDPIRPIEFERRMHLGFDQKTHHLSSYVVPARAARGELATLDRVFFESHGIDTFYAYLPAPDALQHVRGDLGRYLERLDAALGRLLATYRARTGQDLELVLISDHGHNGRWNAETLDLRAFLERHGYTVARKIAAPTDVVFSTDGVTTGVGVFVSPPEVTRLATILATLRGVDLVTWVPDGAADRVGVRDASGHQAWILRRANGDLAYVPASGDPLGYAPLVARLRDGGLLDAEGFAPGQAWLHVSITHEYPAALERIVRGHHEVTQNPAPILVSVRDGFQVANGMTSFFNQLRPLGGTHGGLNAVNSLGIVMSTYRPTTDTLSTDVARQFDGFAQLPVRATH